METTVNTLKIKKVLTAPQYAAVFSAVANFIRVGADATVTFTDVETCRANGVLNSLREWADYHADGSWSDWSERDALIAASALDLPYTQNNKTHGKTIERARAALRSAFKLAIPHEVRRTVDAIHELRVALHGNGFPIDADAQPVAALVKAVESLPFAQQPHAELAAVKSLDAPSEEDEIEKQRAESFRQRDAQNSKVSKTVKTITAPVFGQFAGPNSTIVDLGFLRLWYSYTTLVAFQVSGKPAVVHFNDWSTTTGKHLNAIDGGKGKRFAPQGFKAAYREQVAGLLK